MIISSGEPSNRSSVAFVVHMLLFGDAVMRIEEAREVREELVSFLKRRRVGEVHFAGIGGSPPQLAYITAFSRLSLVVKGRHPMVVGGSAGGRAIRPKQGDVVFVAPHRWNKPDWAEAGKVMTFLFGRQQVGISLTEHEGRGSEPRARAKASLGRPLDAVASGLLDVLCLLAEYDSDRAMNNLVVEAFLHALVRQFDQAPIGQVSKGKRTYEMICLYVQENAQCPLTRELVASRFGLNPSHVSRLFRAEGAMRFSDYVNLARINRSKVLLREGCKAIKEVASDCGYADAAYFCRVFQRYVKMTPTAYRLLRGSSDIM